MSDTLEQEYTEAQVAALKEANERLNGHREKAQIALRIATDHYNELKTHVQDVLRDADLWDEFDAEKLARHGIVKPPTTWACTYKVSYTGSVTIKAETEDEARTKAKEVVSECVRYQVGFSHDDAVTDQNHNEFHLYIDDCEEQ